MVANRHSNLQHQPQSSGGALVANQAQHIRSHAGPSLTESPNRYRPDPETAKPRWHEKSKGIGQATDHPLRDRRN